jgi:hypothetical protein
VIRVARVRVLAKLKLPAIWGSWERGFEAHVTTTKCVEAGITYPCVYPTYIKGVLRRNAFKLLPHLKRLGVADRSLYVELFGPSALEEADSPALDEPACIDVSVGKIVDENEASKILKNWPSVSGVRPVELERAVFIEPRIRIRDESLNVAEGALFAEERVKSGLYLYFEVSVKCPEIEGASTRLLLYSLALFPYEYIARGSPADVCIHVEGGVDELARLLVSSINSKTPWCVGART